MLRAWCKILLVLVIGLYGAHAASAGHHVHEQGEPAACVACHFADSPAMRAAAVEAPGFLAVPTADDGAALPTPPPAPLDPGDVSFATSPPAARV